MKFNIKIIVALFLKIVIFGADNNSSNNIHLIDTASHLTQSSLVGGHLNQSYGSSEFFGHFNQMGERQDPLLEGLDLPGEFIFDFSNSQESNPSAQLALLQNQDAYVPIPSDIHESDAECTLFDHCQIF